MTLDDLIPTLQAVRLNEADERLTDLLAQIGKKLNDPSTSDLEREHLIRDLRRILASHKKKSRK